MSVKHILICLLLFCSLLLLKAGTPVASVVFSNPIVSNNLTHTFSISSSSESYTLQTFKAGESCRQIPAAKYGYFNVNDVTIPFTESNLIINITFYDESNTKINFQYNANDGNNYKSLSVQQTASNGWVTTKLAITNASLRNAQNNACDFRISGNGADIYIKEINIEIGTLTPENEPIPSVSGSSYSEFIGKSVAGYQVWFVAGSLTSGWTHWNARTSGAPGPNTSHFEVCPDISEYPSEILKPTNLAPMGNGTPFKLFTSTDQPIIDTHLRWMKEYGIDGVAVQRFIGNIGGAIIKSPTAPIFKIKQAAEANERIFYICYDTSSSGMEGTWDETIKTDWVYNVEQNDITKSPAYAKVGNKPVVQLWGLGFASDGKNPGTAAETIALIEFLQARGCYVIGGVPKGWRTNNGDAKGPTQALLSNQESFETVYLKLNMISPWMPGRIKTNADADALLASNMIPDKRYCDARNIQYMPVNFPGFAWSQWNSNDVNQAPRNVGDFMWHQATNIKKLDVQNMYFAMFDEYDEGTAIMKNATDWSMIPTDQYFLTSSADGVWLSSDFQLRVAGAAVQMLKGQLAATNTIPVEHSNGPVYYRNSFEKRTTAYNYVNEVATKTGTFNLDPCFYQNAELERFNVLNPQCEIQSTLPRSGLYSVKFTGTIANSTQATYIYKIANVKIRVKPGMTLTFWKRTDNELGRYAFVDLKSQKGALLRTNYNDQNGTSMHPSTAHGTVGVGWEKFSCEFGKGVLLGDTITEIHINYNGVGDGTFMAYFDDFLIEESHNTGYRQIIIEELFSIIKNPEKGGFQILMNGVFEYDYQLYNISGICLISKKSNNTSLVLDLNQFGQGVYILKLRIQNRSYQIKLLST